MYQAILITTRAGGPPQWCLEQHSNPKLPEARPEGQRKGGEGAATPNRNTRRLEAKGPNSVGQKQTPADASNLEARGKTKPKNKQAESTLKAQPRTEKKRKQASKGQGHGSPYTAGMAIVSGAKDALEAQKPEQEREGDNQEKQRKPDKT